MSTATPTPDAVIADRAGLPEASREADRQLCRAYLTGWAGSYGSATGITAPVSFAEFTAAERLSR